MMHTSSEQSGSDEACKQNGGDQGDIHRGIFSVVISSVDEGRASRCSQSLETRSFEQSCNSLGRSLGKWSPQTVVQFQQGALIQRNQAASRSVNISN